MKFYKFALWKAYFDNGYSLTSYFKWAIGMYGLSSLNPKMTLILFTIYGLTCFLVGWVWMKFGFYEAQNEVTNRFNPLAKEIRSSKIFK